MKKQTILPALLVTLLTTNTLADLPHNIETNGASTSNLQENFENLDARLSRIEEMLAVQQSIIAAFRGECPEGWDEYDSAKGRFLLGVNGTRKTGDTGGAESHQLTQEELPSYTLKGTTDSWTHSHDVTMQFSILDGFSGSGNAKAGQGANGLYSVRTPSVSLSSDTHSHQVTVASGGSDKPLSNMPPYYVVRWCVPRNE